MKNLPGGIFSLNPIRLRFLSDLLPVEFRFIKPLKSFVLSLSVIFAFASMAGTTELSDNLGFMGRYNFYPDYHSLLISGDTLFYCDNTMLGALSIADPTRPVFIDETIIPERGIHPERSGDNLLLYFEDYGFGTFNLRQPFRDMFTDFTSLQNLCYRVESVTYGDECTLILDSRGNIYSLILEEPGEYREVFQCDPYYDRVATTSSGDIFFVSERYRGGIQVIDGSDNEDNPLDVIMEDTYFTEMITSGSNLYGLTQNDYLLIADIHNPEDCEVISYTFIEGLPDSFRPEFVCKPYRGILYLRGEARNHGYIFALDVSDPENPQIVADLSELYPQFIEATLDPDRDLLITTSGSAIYSWNISDPTDPQLLSTYGDGEAEPIELRGILFKENHVYLLTENTLYIFDVSRLHKPQLISSFNVATVRYSASLELSTSGQLVIAGSSIMRLDVRDPANPQFLVNFPIIIGLNDLVVDGDIVYLVDSHDMIYVFDISDYYHVRRYAEFSADRIGQIFGMTKIDDCFYIVREESELLSYDVSNIDHIAALDSIQNGASSDLLVLGNTIASQYGNGGNIRLLDCSDPENLRIIGFLRADDNRNEFLRSVSSGTLLYLLGDRWTDVYDFADGYNPVRIASQIDLTSTEGRNRFIAADGNRLVIATSNALTTHLLAGGTDVEPDLDRDEIDFGTVTVGDTLTIPLVVHNRALDPISILFSESDRPAFWGCDQVVEINERSSGEYNLSFCPSGPGEISTQIQIRYTWGWLPLEVRGTGTYCNEESESNGSVCEYHLSQPKPNPFNSSALLEFSIPTASDVKLTLFDTCGRRISELAAGKYQAGTYEFAIDATTLPTGVYLARFTAGEFTKVHKLTVMK